ncbi:MAG: RsmD family RNA methyltransferase [Bifidobacteriaceae bacterium]|jgi:16S rRNA (guanine966-N2)-methyltransferase|nr:RsmD family RNA methyltransferase [Bifidobacteriaceae bacterium]
MVRIIAGAAGGRALKVPSGLTRPTSDRVREALFSLLEARLDGRGGWAGKRVLDLYAGSGAVALEALSRGAACALAVDSSPAAIRAAKANATALDLAERLAFQLGRVEQVVSGPRLPARLAKPAPDPSPAGGAVSGGFDLVFLDPPYDLAPAAVNAVLASLAAPSGPGGRPPWLVGGALVVLERSVRSPAPEWPADWEDLGTRKYGDTALHLARAGDLAPGDGDMNRGVATVAITRDGRTASDRARAGSGRRKATGRGETEGL